MAGLVHLQGVTTAEAARTRRRPRAASRRPASSPKGFAYLCWDLYAEVGRTYAGEARDEGLARGGPPRDRGRRQRDRAHRGRRRRGRSPRRTSRRWGGSASPTTSCRARATSCTSTSGRRAFELLKASGAMLLEKEGKHAGCWVLRPLRLGGVRRAWRSRTRSSCARTAPSPTRARTSPTSSGSSGSSAIDFDYERLRPVWSSGAVREAEIPEAVREHPLWRTAHAGGEPDAPEFGRAEPRLQRHRRAPVLSRRRSCAKVSALSAHRRRPRRSVHFSYEIVALSPQGRPGARRALRRGVPALPRGREEAVRRDVRPQGPRGQGRRPRRAPPRALPRGDRGPAGRGRGRRGGRRGRRPLDRGRARCATSC